MHLIFLCDSLAMKLFTDTLKSNWTFTFQFVGDLIIYSFKRCFLDYVYKYYYYMCTVWLFIILPYFDVKSTNLFNDFLLLESYIKYGL